ncbi:unnamed protein product [Dicrocoelium dendriticum]|nr:unnamed protein product [Dicrocoelium dendriticum]
MSFTADFDHVTCATVGDFTFDGKCEIVLGTFGQRLLFYQWTPLDDSGDDGPERKLKGSYSLLDQKSLIGPIHCLSPPLHLTDDGLASLAVLTSRGLHIYRHKLDTIMHLLHARLSSLLERASNHT